MSQKRSRLSNSSEGSRSNSPQRAVHSNFCHVYGLKMLMESPPESLVRHIHEKEMQNFDRFVQTSADCCNSERMAIFTEILYKVVKIAREPASQCCPRAKTILEVLVDNKCITFWGALAAFIRKLPYMDKRKMGDEHKKVDLFSLIAFCLEFLFRVKQRAKCLQYLPLDYLHASLV